MATSGTTSFNITIDEVIEEAYERCGVRTNSGNDIKSARRSLNLLFSEWGNRGINLWKVKSETTTLVNGTVTYNTPSDCNDGIKESFRVLMEAGKWWIVLNKEKFFFIRLIWKRAQLTYMIL